MSSSKLVVPDRGIFVPYGEDELRHFYDTCFPTRMLADWYGYGDPSYLKRRELAYTDFNDVYIRWNSYESAQDFRKDVISKAPAKIHVGAVYNDEPRKHAEREIAISPQEKELVFDIDANDYDDVRFCPCKGTPAVCKICWGLLENAMMILDMGLREDFGFENIIWVFSGRRGVHGWVCDQKARQLTQEGRSAVASYFAVDLLNLNTTYSLHPSLDRSYKQVLKPYFDNLVDKHDLLLDPAALEAIYKIGQINLDTQKALQLEWEDADVAKTSRERWNRICVEMSEAKLKTLIFHFAYPRLDIQVSKQWNHLLKAPLTVHPSTGMICVPITADPVRTRGTFDPTAAPRIHEVVAEVDLVVKNTGVERTVALRSTSLKESLQILETFVLNLVKERRRIKNESQGADSF